MKEDAATTPMGHRKKASLSYVATWVIDAWEDLSVEIINTGFKKCCISNTIDGSEDDILWEAADDCGEFDDDLILCTPDKDEALDND